MRRYALPLLCGLLLGLAQNALADRGGHHGHDHDRDRYDDRRDYREDDRRHDRRPDRRERYEEPRYYAAPPPPPRSSGVNINIQFGGGERQLIREYYDPRFLAGNCPPGSRLHAGTPSAHASSSNSATAWRSTRPIVSPRSPMSDPSRPRWFRV